jgi:hypothetical protein
LLLCQRIEGLVFLFRWRLIQNCRFSSAPFFQLYHNSFLFSPLHSEHAPTGDVLNKYHRTLNTLALILPISVLTTLLRASIFLRRSSVIGVGWGSQCIMAPSGSRGVHVPGIGQSISIKKQINTYTRASSYYSHTVHSGLFFLMKVYLAGAFHLHLTGQNVIVPLPNEV